MGSKRVMKLASRSKRLGAFCIDAIIPFVVMLIFLTATGFFKSNYKPYGNYPFGNNPFGEDPFNGYGYGYGFGYGYGNPGQAMSNSMAMLVVIASFVFLAYLVVQLVFFSKSKTMGKASLGLQVISSKNGKAVGFWMMLFREWIVKSASSRVFLLGYFWVLIDEQNRGWHDKILDTYVVDIKESEILNNPTSSQEKEPAETIPEPLHETEPETGAEKTNLPMISGHIDREEPVETEENETLEKKDEKDM